MDAEKIRDLLEKTIPVDPVFPPSSTHQGPGSVLARGVLDTEEGEAFLEVFIEADGLELFDESMQSLGGNASAFGRREVALWLIERARVVGADIAISDLRTYLREDTFQAFHVMLLTGIQPDECFALGNGISLVPISKIPSTKLRAHAIRNRYSAISFTAPTAALVVEAQHKKYHPSQGPEKKERLPFGPEDLPPSALEIARLCISSLEGRAPQPICTGTGPADHVPTAPGMAWALHGHNQPLMAPQLIKTEANQIRKFHEKFVALPNDIQVRLSIPLRRLNAFSTLRELAEQAVDIRIALESLFLTDDEQDELSYRLGLRGALLLGTGYEEREEIFGTVRKAYRIGSKAVHHGQVPGKDLEQAPEILENTADIIRKGIRAFLENPNIHWRRLELAGG